MPDYSFSFDPAASGLPYTIKNRAGETVDSGTLDESDDVAKVTVTLPWGTYDGVASVAPAPYASTPAYFAKGDQLANQPGASETDGVGCVFFGGTDLAVAINNTEVFCDFVRTDEGPRAPARDDLLILDEDDEDNTTLLVVRSGLYDITLNTPVHLKDVVYTVGDPGDLVNVTAAIQFGVNGESQPPAYDFNNRAYWMIDAEAGFTHAVALSITFPQILLAGDLCQLGFRATQTGTATIGGTLELHPDITMVCTFRGAVDPADYA